ncbi:MAG: ADP-ribosylglycohydrolase family protein, partial [Bacteroidales bacterium]|nr:ADP-ribosylglycohydrolase family protein [Lentimicrobiaceae bacterium]MDD5695541.1 ADP-ribosylglycohydrolase family protein [Bacteroidales bacterium]
ARVDLISNNRSLLILQKVVHFAPDLLVHFTPDLVVHFAPDFTSYNEMAEIATRSTWKNIPIDDPKRIDISLHFTDKQFSRLINGLIPQQMEDKWFVFYEDGWLYFHRSWTGCGIYKAQLHKERQGYSIKDFFVERNMGKYSNTDDDEDIEKFRFLVIRGLLGIDVRNIYAAANLKTEADTLSSWSDLGNLLFTSHGLDITDKIRSVLFGVAVGDALGVPVEFKSRQRIRQKPVTDMVGFGTHNQPEGTWSDDSSLTFCLAEALTHNFNIDNISRNFIKWYYDNYWTARGDVFDIGNATRQAIEKLSKGVKPDVAGCTDASSNGNGSLMRISPLLFYLLDKSMNERYEIAKQVSSITHGHIRSVIACFYYLEFARQLFFQNDKFEIYENLQPAVSAFLDSLSINPTEIKLFARLLKGNVYELPEEEIASGGYVLHTLEASIWCLLTTNDYKEAVLKAVNLGEDTDTTGAITGGLAGLLYGFDNIPVEWINKIARNNDIEDLAERLGQNITVP